MTKVSEPTLTRIPLEYDLPFLFAIGRLTAAFAGTEGTLRWYTAWLVSPSEPEIAAMVLAGETFDRLKQLFQLVALKRLKQHRTLADATRADLEKQIAAMMARLQKAQEERNFVVHAEWFPFPDGEHPEQIKPGWTGARRKRAKDQVDHRTADEIDRAASQIEVLRIDFIKLAVRVLNRLGLKDANRQKRSRE